MQTQTHGRWRAAVNRHPGWTVVAVLAAAGLCLGVTCWPRPGHKAFYTIDDGQTWFAHEYVVPPFDYRGKQAVQAVLFTCDAGKTRFVGYLLRFTPEGKTAMERLLAHRSPRDARGPIAMPHGQVQVKRPGKGTWAVEWTPQEMGQSIERAVKSGHNPTSALQGQSAYAQIVNVRCPDGKMAIPVGAD